MKLSHSLIAGFLILASYNSILSMDHSIKIGINHNLDSSTTATLKYVGESLENTGNYLAETGNSIATTSKFLYETGITAQNIVDNAITSTDNLFKNHLKKIENITTTISNNLEYSLQNFSKNIQIDFSRLIKTTAISCAGLGCCGAGIWLFVQGMQKTFSNQITTQDKQTIKNESLWQRCTSILQHPPTAGIIQSGIGIATFLGGILTVTKSERILNYLK